MANWYGAARSNYVRIKDMEGLENALAPFPIEISTRHNDGTVCFLSEDEYGGWPSFTYDEEDNEIDFDPTTQICPFMEDDQILVMMQSGAEKLRYITGDAQAYNAKGESCFVSLMNIYGMAAQYFNVPVGQISSAEY